ncbi:MbtH family protein [Rhizobium paknamense]|uniref:MbtH protein n=1 Tax=Rhizobium paknamense TaxID=1206817 RepID=A0ABU0IJC9_9HYPH|nr:MbtH family protein [Rhizobium paknamense]MDQ0458341.1 MbtH protein [Rhizobium paknamense]
MANPFDDLEADFLVLRNEELQHSIWPQSITIPLGWSVVFGPAKKDLCLEFVRDVWSDLRPKSIVNQLAS